MVTRVSFNADNEIKIVASNGLPVIISCLRMDEVAVQVSALNLLLYAPLTY